MKLKNKVLTGLSLLAAGMITGTEVTLDRLGYATTLFPFLPHTWQAAIVSSPVLMWAAVVCFFAAMLLLGSVAWFVAKIAETGRKSNERAWAFDAEFADLRHHYQEVLETLQAIREQQSELTDEIRTKNDNLAGLKAEIETQVEANHSKLSQELQEAVSSETARTREAAETLVSTMIQNDQMQLRSGMKALQRDMEAIEHRLQGKAI